MSFKPNRKFKRKYNRLFKKDSEAANLFLLLCELADEKGQVETNEEELAKLMTARFNDPEEYALERVGYIKLGLNSGSCEFMILRALTVHINIFSHLRLFL